MDQIIGFPAEVTLQNPPGAVVLGIVAGVDQQTSRLMLTDGELHSRSSLTFGLLM
jgi:hypothetical protein